MFERTYRRARALRQAKSGLSDAQRTLPLGSLPVIALKAKSRWYNGRVVGNPHLGITSGLPVIQELSGNFASGITALGLHAAREGPTLRLHVKARVEKQHNQTKD